MATDPKTIEIPALRLFPRWKAPKSLRGNYPNVEASKRAQAALAQRRKTGPTSELEHEIMLDPDIALVAAAQGYILDRSAIQDAIFRKPLLVPQFARRCRWANLNECLVSVNSHAELAWEFHTQGLDADPNRSASTFLESFHYAWRALRELPLSKESADRISEFLREHPLYGAMLEPEGIARRNFLLLRQNDSKEGALTGLLWRVTQLPNDPFPKDEMMRLLEDKVALTPIGKEILTWIGISKSNQDEETGIEPHVLHHYLGRESIWVYHLALACPRTANRLAHVEHLKTLPQADGWLMQLSLETGSSIPKLSPDAIYEYLTLKTQTPEELVEINKWKLEVDVTRAVISDKRA